MQDFTTTQDGFRFGYRLYAGEARLYRPVVLIGGAFQTMDALHRFAVALSKRTDVLVVEPPGTGDSDPLPARFGTEFLASCVHRAMVEADLGRANLVGISFGSVIAYEVARRQPESADGLVMLGTMSELDERIVAGLEDCRFAIEQGDRERFVETTLRVLLNRGKSATIRNFRLTSRILRATTERMSALAVEHFLTNAQRLLFHRRLETDHPPTTRTLVVTGEHDHVTTPDHCRRVAAALPNASLALVEDADHLMPLERPDVCIGLVDLFLRRFRLLEASACSKIDHFAAGAERSAAA